MNVSENFLLTFCLNQIMRLFDWSYTEQSSKKKKETLSWSGLYFFMFLLFYITCICLTH